MNVAKRFGIGMLGRRTVEHFRGKEVMLREAKDIGYIQSSDCFRRVWHGNYRVLAVVYFCRRIIQ